MAFGHSRSCASSEVSDAVRPMECRLPPRYSTSVKPSVRSKSGCSDLLGAGIRLPGRRQSGVTEPLSYFAN